MVKEYKPFFPAALNDSGLTSAELRVLLYIIATGSTFSRTSTIARVCRLHRGTVRRSLKDLAKGKWIITEQRPGMTNLHRTGPETNKAYQWKQMRTGGGNKSGRPPETNKADKLDPSEGDPSKRIYTKKSKLEFKEAR
jgi:hypothetical protein